ncbi:hypothetical protein BGZ67_003640 [Mortierella alpina]|nr:hypothetical protein BGZ67_003640 [Mortierella alpina]
MSYITQDPNKILVHYEKMRLKFNLGAPSDSPAMPTTTAIVSGSSQNTLTESSDSSELPSPAQARHSEGLSEQQRVDLESIKEAIETATHIISILEHYSVDGEPFLLSHAEDAAGRSGAADSSLFLGSASRPGSRILQKSLSPNVIGMAPSRILNSSSTAGMTVQSRKKSVVSEYDSMMYEVPEYEAQYVTTLSPIDRDEVVFRPLHSCV